MQVGRVLLHGAADSGGLRVSERPDFAIVNFDRDLVSDPAAPFGEMKQSGIGREGARQDIKHFLEAPYVSLNW
jgi:succinate-semialdehyde dehydrogenase / glutarate-semialdehyde dehydrogenase